MNLKRARVFEEGETAGTMAEGPCGLESLEWKRDGIAVQ